MNPGAGILATLPIGRAVCRLGYTSERAEMEPMYIQPVLVQVEEPTDAQIEAVLGRISL